jgi:hypothetical protein
MRLPRVRFTVRTMMVAVAILAAAFAAIPAWIEVVPYQWRRHLDIEMTWCQSPEGAFFAKCEFKFYTANSLLLVSDLGRADREGYYSIHRWRLGPRGELWESQGSGGGQHYLTATELAQAQQMISKLPPSTGSFWHGDPLLVASLSEGSWVTRVYDKAALPPAVQDLAGVLRLGLE